LNKLELWNDIKNGDVKALQALHNAYFYSMCLFTQKTVADKQQAESIVSDCFLKLWENRKKIEIKTSLESYMYRMIRNQIIDFYRGKQEKAELVDEFPDIPNETVFDEQQRYGKLYQAILKLPEQRRKILELAVFESLSYQQVADKLNISKNTVKTQIARSYQFLKNALDAKDFNLFILLFKK